MLERHSLQRFKSQMKAWRFNVKLRSPAQCVCLMLILAGCMETARGQDSPGAKCDEITVFGAVKTPGQFKVADHIRLREALTRAGGPNERAGKVVRVIRSCKCTPCAAAQSRTSDIEYDLATALRGQDSANPHLVAGDVVIIPETEIVSVIGNVMTQRSLTFRKGMTLTRAIAIVGIARNSDLVRVKIHHPSSHPYQMGIVTLKTITDGDLEDPQLRPGDILEVSDEQGRFVWDDRKPKIYRDPPLFPRKSPIC
jgi:protein involved in polysaccharide export with SLBB domain